MEMKLIEVRDVATRLSVLAIKLGSTNEAEDFILQSAGYGSSYEQPNYVLLVDLVSPPRIWLDYQETEYQTQGARTFSEAHKELEQNWSKYKSGDVLDVQFVLGETPKPKESDRFWRPNPMRTP